MDADKPLAAPTGTTRQFPRRKRIWLMGAVLLAVCWFAFFQPMARKALLSFACRGATRVVYVINSPPLRTNNGWSVPERIAVPIEGRPAVSEFLTLLSLRPSMPCIQCACGGDFRVELADDTRTLAELSFHHGRSVRWRHGFWLGDSSLDGTAAQSVQKWIMSRGGTELASAKRRASILWDTFKAERDKEVAEFERQQTQPASAQSE